MDPFIEVTTRGHVILGKHSGYPNQSLIFKGISLFINVGVSRSDWNKRQVVGKIYDIEKHIIEKHGSSCDSLMVPVTTTDIPKPRHIKP